MTGAAPAGSGAPRGARDDTGAGVTEGAPPLERVQALDEWAFRRVAEWHAPVLDRALPTLSEAASYSRLWMAVAALLAVFGGRRGRRTAAAGLVAIGATSALANITMKGLAKRPRPHLAVPERRRLEHPGSTSFPSGHTASAAAFSGVVGAEIPTLRTPLDALAVAVGFSRVYTGVHYPGDVAVGWVLGRTVAGVVRRVLRHLETL